jgi:hypothetical protein
VRDDVTNRFREGDVISEDNMGSFGAELCRVSKSGLKTMIIVFAVMCFVATTILLGVEIWFLVTGGTVKEPLPALLASGAFPCLGFLLLWVSKFFGRKSWIFTEEALLETKRSGFKIRFFWRDANGIQLEHQFHHAVADVLTQCTIYIVTDRETIIFDNRDGFDTEALSKVLFTAGERIANKSKRDFISKIDRGETIRLGPLMANVSGFSWRDGQLAWNMIKELRHSVFFLHFLLADGTSLPTKISMLYSNQDGLFEVGMFAHLLRHYSGASVVI